MHSPDNNTHVGNCATGLCTKSLDTYNIMHSPDNNTHVGNCATGLCTKSLNIYVHHHSPDNNTHVGNCFTGLYKMYWYNNLAESNSTCNYVGNVRTFTRAEAERAFAVDILFTVAATVSALILI